MADRRLRQVEVARRGRHAALREYRVENAQQVEIEPGEMPQNLLLNAGPAADPGSIAPITQSFSPLRGCSPPRLPSLSPPSPFHPPPPPTPTLFPPPFLV